jgi:hypothetical protein
MHCERETKKMKICGRLFMVADAGSSIGAVVST